MKWSPFFRLPFRLDRVVLVNKPKRSQSSFLLIESSRIPIQSNISSGWTVFFLGFYRAQTQADHYRIHRRMSVLWKEIKNQRKIKRKFWEKKKIFPSRSVRRATAAFYRVCLPSFSIFLFFFIYTNGILRERRTDLTAHRRDRERETDRWSRASFFFLSFFFFPFPFGE